MKPLPSSPAGEFLMLRLAASEWSTAWEQQLRAHGPGGVVLASPLPAAPEVLHDLLSGISRSLAGPLILAPQAGLEEGPLSGLLQALPSPSWLAEQGARAVCQVGELIGEALRLLGFNTIFAPTLDLASACADPIPAAGTFSADPTMVAKCGASFVEGLSRHKILACGKHFPGRASASTAREGELPTSMRSMADLWRSDLVPYRELLARLPMVLMSSAAYRAYDYDYPRSAVLSPQVVDGLLRSKLGFGGVVVAPQLEYQPTRGGLDIRRAAVECLFSGCDMLLVENVESWQVMRRGIDEVFSLGQRSRERLEQSLTRIRAVKRACTPPQGPFQKKAWDRLAQRWEQFRSGH